MKHLLITLLGTMVVGLLAVTPPVVAQTSGGATPAEEKVCDVLIGLTPGLYGMCVAYCEAHDAELISPDGDLAILNTPNRKILENYNKKKTEFDPPMPCVQDPCPCWTADELSLVLPPTTDPDANFPNACHNGPFFGANPLLLIEDIDPSADRFLQFWAADGSTGTSCRAEVRGHNSLPPILRAMSITSTEFAACANAVVTHANIYKTDGIVWDCFAP